ncbi:MAG: hypothetical protein ACE37M_07385 [Henriciella sp.]
MLSHVETPVLDALYEAPDAAQVTLVSKPETQTGMPFPDHPEPDANGVNTSVHPRVYQILGGLFFGILGVFYMVFAAQADTVFMIAICAVYFAMYFGTVAALVRVTPDRTKTRQGFDSFLNKPFDTFTGQITGREVVMQICLVPGLVLTGCALIGVIIVSVR